MQANLSVTGVSGAVIALIVLTLVPRPAAATDVSGDQSGTWSLAGSPYTLVGDVRVPPGLTLVIEPGVQVTASGHFALTVEQGTLLAVGTAGQPILMTATPQNPGWRGLRLLSADDATTISHCTIEYARGDGPYPEVRGGAIYALECSPTITHNEIRFSYSRNGNANGTGAGITVESSDALIAYNDIHDNEADSGGGVCCLEYGTPHVLGNLIRGNRGYYAGGGIYLGARNSALIDRNYIVDNWSAGWGGGGVNSWTSFIFYGTYATIRNNVIARNTATTDGGGLYCRYDRALLRGNTIVFNSATGTGGGIFALNFPEQAPQVTSTIVWGNTAGLGPQIYRYPDTGSEIAVQFSDVEGGWSGTGNRNLNPQFVDGPNGDYHLAPGSPCVDSGDPNYEPVAGERDIDGQLRRWDGSGELLRVDIGADEFGSHLPGDLNCDGAFDGADIDPFFLALGDPAAYAHQFPACDLLLGDMNRDGGLDGADIDPFFQCLGGDCE